MVISLLVGALLGWAASRLVFPVPERIFVSTTLRCDVQQYLVTVPFAHNVRWTVQGGATQSYWDMLSSRWSRTPRWHAGPGKTVVEGAETGVRILADGFGRDSNIAGVTVTSVAVIRRSAEELERQRREEQDRQKPKGRRKRL